MADVRDPGHAARVVAAATERHGRVDIVVANAGIGYAGDVVAMSADDVRALVEVNVTAPVLLAAAAVPGMVERRRGALVFVTSIAGALLVPGETVYSMTKAAVEAFADPLREELRGSGVAVSTVLPGAVETSFFATRGRAYDRRFPRPIPARRVADAVVAAVTTGRARTVTPGWLRVAVLVRTLVPGCYRAMARRVG